MKPILLIFTLIFITTTYILYKYSYSYFRQETNDKMWKLWGLQTPYWEGLILISLDITTVTLLLVKTII